MHYVWWDQMTPRCKLQQHAQLEILESLHSQQKNYTLKKCTYFRTYLFQLLIINFIYIKLQKYAGRNRLSFVTYRPLCFEHCTVNQMLI